MAELLDRDLATHETEGSNQPRTSHSDWMKNGGHVRRTNKWHKFPPDVLPAWVADMDFGVAPSIAAALARLTRDQEYGYAARDGVLAAAFVRRMERRFGWHTDPADTIAVGDLVQASFSSVMAFSEPSDAILLQLPSYPPFMRAIEDAGRRLIANPMRDDDMRWVLDLGAYEATRNPRLRMLIFCHPQNPTGRAFRRPELEEVADFAIRHDLVVVSDEIHADIVYPGHTHIPLIRQPLAESNQYALVESCTTERMLNSLWGILGVTAAV